jgi:hypothetical protein
VAGLGPILSHFRCRRPRIGSCVQARSLTAAALHDPQTIVSVGARTSDSVKASFGIGERWRAGEAGTPQARADATGERAMWIERFWRVS